MNAISLCGFNIHSQICKDRPLIGLQALVEKVFMGGSLQVDIICIVEYLLAGLVSSKSITYVPCCR